LVIGQAPASAVSVALDGQAVPLGPDRRFPLGFGREAPASATLTVTHADGRVTSQTITVQARTFNIQRVDGLPPRTVVLPPELKPRRDEELRRIGQARLTQSAQPAWAGRFVWPAQGRITGVYGSQRIRNGVPGSPHWGVDVANATGTPILAPADGVVTLAEPDLLLEGGLIILDHGQGVFTDYMHLSAVNVKVGDVVKQGQRIGALGSTGRSTGPHLHWGLAWRATAQAPLLRLDPTLILGLAPPMSQETPKKTTK
jgi:murein DD-endopeptidase MepM/ murein hydrolase activator NlpD